MPSAQTASSMWPAENHTPGSKMRPSIPVTSGSGSSPACTPFVIVAESSLAEDQSCVKAAFAAASSPDPASPGKPGGWPSAGTFMRSAMPESIAC